MAEVTEPVNDTGGVRRRDGVGSVAAFRSILPSRLGGLRMARLPLTHGPDIRFFESGSADRGPGFSLKGGEAWHPNVSVRSAAVASGSRSARRRASARRRRRARAGESRPRGYPPPPHQRPVVLRIPNLCSPPVRAPSAPRRSACPVLTMPLLFGSGARCREAPRAGCAPWVPMALAPYPTSTF